MRKAFSFTVFEVNEVDERLRFEEGIIGMEVGEAKDLNLTFPDNYTEELKCELKDDDQVCVLKSDKTNFFELTTNLKVIERLNYAKFNIQWKVN